MLKMLGATLGNLVWAPLTIFLFYHKQYWPIPVAAQSKAARLLRSWVRIPPDHGCLLSVVSVVCCQVEVSATS